MSPPRRANIRVGKPFKTAPTNPTIAMLPLRLKRVKNRAFFTPDPFHFGVYGPKTMEERQQTQMAICETTRDAR
nr:hypothetical protein [uncultured bacterium]